MKFNIEKRRQLDDFDSNSYIHNYHQWLEKQREKDKAKIPDKVIMLSNHYLAKGLCPYCRKEIDIIEEIGVTKRVCAVHGLLGVKKKEYKIWFKNKKRMGDETT